jgi:CheY-like chemotaxis protein
MGTCGSASRDPRYSSKSNLPILVVEDDVSTLVALCDFLKLEGYAVAAAPNGSEALDYLHRYATPCLIILDLMMPQMDGWRFREAQKKDPALAGCPVVVISASIPNAAIDADLVLQKPVDLDGLLNAVSEYC